MKKKGKKRIMIVEDERLIAEDIKTTLEDLGYDIVAITPFAEEAIKIAGKKQPDLVLMDIVLKGEMDGIQAAEQIRKMFMIPIIYLTAYANDKTLEDAKITEPFGYIIKPFEERELHSAIEMGLYKDKAEKKMLRLNNLLLSIRNVNQIISKEKNRDKLLNGICENLIMYHGYYHAWIGIIDSTNKFVSIFGKSEDKSKLLFEKWIKKEKLPECINKALSKPDVVVINDAGECNCSLSKKYTGHGALTIRLETDGKIYGVMSVSTPPKLVIDDEELSLFNEVAADVAFALHNLELEEEHERIEKAMRNSEEKYRSLVENASDFIFMVKQNGEVLSLNQAAAKIFGKKPENITGISISDLFPKDIANNFLKSIKEVHKTGLSNLIDGLMKVGNKEYWISTNLNPIKDSNGNVISVLGVTRDITERLRTEEALRQSEEKYSSVVENSKDAIIIHQNGIIKFANSAAGQFSGYDIGDLLERNMLDFITPDYKDLVLKRYSDRLQGKDVPNIYEISIFKKDGEVMPLEISASTMKYQGEPSALVFLRDITERKQAEEALIQKTRKLERFAKLAVGREKKMIELKNKIKEMDKGG